MPPLISDLDQRGFACLMAECAPFETAPHVAVAVSGGADSLALTLLLDQWCRQQGGRLTALTVDHQLRPQSTDEAQWVAAQLAARRIDHRILVWHGVKPTSDIQSAARQARHHLLTEYCRQAGILHLALAHHLDDQAETLLLRLARGSGVHGLSAMAAVQYRWSLRLLRPLLGVGKEQLKAYLHSENQPWIDDPSNDCGHYDRVGWRRLAPQLAELGADSRRLAQTALGLRRAGQALDSLLTAAMVDHVTVDPAGFCWLDPVGLRRLPAETSLRLLSRLLMAVSGGDHPPRLDGVRALLLRMGQGDFTAATLAGCRILAVRDRVLFCREPARCQSAMAISAGQSVLWDGRVRVQAPVCLGDGWSIGPLGVGGWRQVERAAKPHRLPHIPAAARPTIPAFFYQQAISAVPYLGYKQQWIGDDVGPGMIIAPRNPLTSALCCLVS